MVDKKKFSKYFVLAFMLVTVYLFNNSDRLAIIIANDGIWGTFWYFVSNPAYMLLIASIFILNAEAGLFKNIIGSFMIIYASDIISYPRFSPLGLTSDINFMASLDGLVMTKLLGFGFSYSNAYLIYYLVLPIALIIGALSILGIHNFYNQLFGKEK